MATIQLSSHIFIRGALLWTDGVRARVEHGGKAIIGKLLTSRD